MRGLNDTRVPLLFSALSFWGIGFTSCYALAFSAGSGRSGRMDRPVAGADRLRVLLVWRFHVLSREGYLPELPPGA